MDIGQIRLQNMLSLINNYKTQTEFAAAIDKPASYISQLKKGTKPNGDSISMGSDFARDIETSLGLKHGWMDVLHLKAPKPSPSELMQRIRDIENGGARDSSTAPLGTSNIAMAENSDEVPILSWVAAGSWSNVEAVCFDDAIGRVSRPKNLSKNGFALIVRGESMLPKFDPDDIIYVEPETGLFALKNNDLVIVQCNHDTEATFKQLVLGETSEDMYLRPLNPSWHEQKMLPMGDCNLVGKVVGKYVEY